MTEYRAPSSLLMLEKILNPLRLDSQRSDISLLANRNSESGGTDDTKAYMINNMILPIAIVAFWILLLLSLLFFKHDWCHLRRRCCVLGGTTFTTRNTNSDMNMDDDDDDENAAANLDLITIVSDEDFLVRGNIEDNVRYLKLKGQLRLIRNIFCLLALLVFGVSVPTMLFVGRLQYSHSSVVEEVAAMATHLNGGGMIMGKFIKDRDSLVDTNERLLQSIDTSSQDGCFDDDDDEIIADAAIDLSTSLWSLNQNLNLTKIQEQKQILDDAGSFASDVDQKLRWISPLFTVNICCVALTAVSSISLFVGTTIARKNSLRPWHRIMFQFISFPIGILSSTVLWMSLPSLIFLAIPLVDFCTGAEQDPTESVLSILDAKGFDNSTMFYSGAKMHMERTCSDAGAMESISDNMELAAASVGVLEAFERNSTCQSYTSLSANLEQFNELYVFADPDIHISNSKLNCEALHEWYTDVAFDETCGNAPTSLFFSLQFTFILALLSTLQLFLSIAWKTDTQVFLEISGVGELDDDETVDEEENQDRSYKNNSVRFSRRKEMNVKTPMSLFDESNMINPSDLFEKEESEKKAEFWKNLLKNNGKQRKKDARDDILQQLAAIPGKNYETWQSDDPVEHGEVEVEAQFLTTEDYAKLVTPSYKAYWQDPRGNYQSYDLFGQNEDNSLLHEAMELAEQEDRESHTSRGQFEEGAGIMEQPVMNRYGNMNPMYPPISDQSSHYQDGAVAQLHHDDPHILEVDDDYYVHGDVMDPIADQPPYGVLPSAFGNFSVEDIENFISGEPMENEEIFYEEDEHPQSFVENQIVQEGHDLSYELGVNHQERSYTPYDYALNYGDEELFQDLNQVSFNPRHNPSLPLENGQQGQQMAFNSQVNTPSPPLDDQNLYQEILNGANTFNNQQRYMNQDNTPQNNTEWEMGQSTTSEILEDLISIRDTVSGNYKHNELRPIGHGQQVSNHQQNMALAVPPKQSSQKEGQEKPAPDRESETKADRKSKRESSSRKKGKRSSTPKKSRWSRKKSSKRRKNRRVISEHSLESSDSEQYSTSENESSWTMYSDSEDSDDDTSDFTDTSYEESIRSRRKYRHRRRSRSRSKSRSRHAGRSRHASRNRRRR